MFESAILNFVDNLSALKSFVEFVEPQLEINETSMQYLRAIWLVVWRDTNPMSKEQEEEIAKTCAEIIRIKSETDSGVVYEFKNGHAKNALDAINEVKLKGTYRQLLYKNSLISLISMAEAFVSQLLHQYFDKHKDALPSKESILTLEELKSFSSIEEAIIYLIRDRIEEILRGGPKKWIKFFETTIKLPMGHLASYLPKILEVFQRRHLLVHNNGIVNLSYLSNIDAELKVGIQVGQKIPVSREYLETAIALFQVSFILIAAELWKKLTPKDSNRSTTLTKVASQCLSNRMFLVAEGLGYFVMMDKNNNEASRLNGTMIYWFSKRLSNDFDSIREEVENADFSAKEPSYQFVKQIILCNTEEEFIKLLPEVIESGKLSVSQLRALPIFNDMMKKANYKAVLLPYVGE